MEILYYLAICSAAVAAALLFIDPKGVDALPFEIRTIAIFTGAVCAAVFCACLVLILIAAARIVW